MSMVATSSALTENLPLARPSFFGLVRGELFKMRRQWTTWILLVLFSGSIFLPYLIMFAEHNLKDVIAGPGNAT